MSPENDFDARARTWDDDPMKVARAHAVADGIRAAVPLSAAMRALEYGCGTGLLGFALRGDVGHFTLADSSPGMLAVLDEKIAAAGADNLRSLKLDLGTDPRPDDRFDLLCSMMTLHHVDDTDAILRDWHALLRSPGTLCVADLDAEDGSFHGAGFTGHKGFDRAELAERARRAGFGAVAFSTVFEIRKEGGAQEVFPVFLMVARK